MSNGDGIKIDWNRPPLIALVLVIIFIAARILTYLIRVIIGRFIL